MTAETWISVDIETSGPTPHTGSLLSVGACPVFEPERGIEIRLRPDPGLPWMAEAEAIHRLDRVTLEREGVEPAAAMAALEQWLEHVVVPGTRPVFVALNATFDWMFVADAFWRHLGRNPFGVSGLDVKALFMGRHLDEIAAWAGTSRLRMLERYPVDLPHTHEALDDAREQAAIVRGILGGTGTFARSQGAQPLG
ncbi:MAG: 3'-5' exonuclease [Chloroflexota bacterium]